MEQTAEHRKSYDETDKLAAVEFLERTGTTPEAAAAELGVPSASLRNWSKEATFRRDSEKGSSGLARLKAENEALRNEILLLQVQWDILKTTLGVLSSNASLV